jgi:hypothetical protein
MNIDHDDEDNGGNGHDHDYSPPALDPFTAALVLIDLAQNPKATKAALKKLAQLDKSIGTAEAKLAAVTAQTEQIKAALDVRAAELDAREAEIARREDEFANSLADARNNLRQYHDSLAQEDRRIRYRILSSANLLHGYNERLQDLPSWQQIKKMVPDLPPDLPTPAAEVVTREVREDWSGNVFAPSTLTRSVPAS